MSNQEREPRQERKPGKALSSGTLIALAAALVLLAAAVLYLTVIRPLSAPRGAEPIPADEPSLSLSEPQELIASDPALPEPVAEPPSSEDAPAEPQQEPQEEPKPAKTYAPAADTDKTKTLDLQIYSENGILIDLETNTVLSCKEPDARIWPASMTKVMTALVACERIENWDDTFTMTQAIIDPLYLADATLAGFVDGEDVTMLDLVYGCVLPSGAEATQALAIHLAGSEEAFVELMNQKAQELGLQDTHFVDTSGLHDPEHYTTVRDMAVILQAAMDNDVCRQVLTSARHTTQKTKQNPEGVDLYNKFLIRAESADQAGAQIQGAKTGFTTQAMNCCASFGLSADGKPVLCVTAHAWTTDFCLADHIAMYSLYAG